MLIAHTSMDQDSINALRENLVDMLKYVLGLIVFSGIVSNMPDHARLTDRLLTSTPPIFSLFTSLCLSI